MRLYNLLLYLYPSSFRSQYGSEMYQVFAERRRQVSNPVAVLALWIETFFEIIFNAAHVHWDILRQDLQYTARGLYRSPGFAVTAIVVTALGIGATTAVFSITDHALIRPLPFPDSYRLVKLYQNMPAYPRTELSAPTYRDWKRMSTSFESMGAFATGLAVVIGPGAPRRLEISAITTDAFEVLGIKPFLGRSFTVDDDREDTPPIVLLSYGLWQSEFGSDPEVVGKSFRIDDKICTVIGVMPPDFYFPNRTTRLWRHFSTRHPLLTDSNRNNNFLYVVAKLKTTVSLQQAQAEMRVITDQLTREYPKENEKTKATVIPLREDVSGQSRLLLVALFGASLCLVFIACTNLASVMLARVLARQRELLVRCAIGAGRERLVRQLLTESLVLAALGGIAGMMVAIAGLPLLTTLVPATLPAGDPTALDLRVLAFAASLTFVTGLGFGVIPAFRSVSATHLEILRSKSGIGGRRERLRSVLVVAQVTASVVLLISSGLLIRALLRVQGTNPGFRTENVLAVSTPLPGELYNAARRIDFYTRVLTQVRALPGVTHAAFISFLPMVLGAGIQPVNGVEDDSASLRFVTPVFFSSLQIPIREGRDISETDTLETPLIAVVSESFVLRHFPGIDPIGREFSFANGRRQIVGVVGDIRVRGLERTSEPQVYLPYKQMPDRALSFYSPKELVVRSSADTAALIPAIRRIVKQADPELPVEVRTLEDIVSAQTSTRAAQVRILGSFAALSLLLLGLGIHGLLSFAVSQRLPEIGLRMALGARTADILRMVFRQSLLLALLGSVFGSTIGYAAGRWIQALLAGVSPADLPSFVSAAVLAFVMTVSGSLIPALRAIRVDPTTVIRME
jgi:predicted permease